MAKRRKRKVNHGTSSDTDARPDGEGRADERSVSSINSEMPTAPDSAPVQPESAPESEAPEIETAASSPAASAAAPGGEVPGKAGNGIEAEDPAAVVEQPSEPAIADTVAGLGTDDGGEAAEDGGHTADVAAAERVETSNRLAAWIAAAIDVDRQALESESTQWLQLAKAAETWERRYDDLILVVDSMVLRFADALRWYERDEQALSEDLRAELDGRADGIRLCGRMMTRAHTRLREAAAPEREVDEGPPASLTEAGMASEVEALPVDAVESRIAAILKQRRVAGHKNLAACRRYAAAIEKVFVATVERQLLPIVDGLAEGRRISAQLVGELVAAHPAEKAHLTAWFDHYQRMIDCLHGELARLDIVAFGAEPGDAVDYTRFDPVDVEADPELPDEAVKECLRLGYSLETGDQDSRVIRPGQVVVVRNPDTEIEG